MFYLLLGFQVFSFHSELGIQICETIAKREYLGFVTPAKNLTISSVSLSLSSNPFEGLIGNKFEALAISAS